MRRTQDFVRNIARATSTADQFLANTDLPGGTWFENVYPGVRCDIPSHVYQATFSSKLDWTDQFSPGAEIRDYWQSQAQKYDVYKYAQFGQRRSTIQSGSPGRNVDPDLAQRQERREHDGNS